jgi:hypothetical protein
VSMHPFVEATAHAALANLEEAIATLRAAGQARTQTGRDALVLRARVQAVNAAAKLRDALMLEEMAVTNGDEGEEAVQ